MKKQMWISRLSRLLSISLLVATSACQKSGPVNAAKQQFQTQARQVVGQYADIVSSAYGAARGTSCFRGSRGTNRCSPPPVTPAPTTTTVVQHHSIFFGGFGQGYVGPYRQGGFNNPNMWQGFNPYGNQPFGGQQNIMRDLNSEVTACVSLVANVPPIAQNFYYMIGSLGRCLDMIVNHQNPLMTYGYRNMDDSSQLYWQYLLNFRQPGTFSQFPQQAPLAGGFAPWNNFAGTGSFFNNGVPF